MTETLILDTPHGSRFARAWLAVSSAASTDKTRPALYRVVVVAVYDTGVRLTSTDSYWSAEAWVGDPVDPDDPDLGRHGPPGRREQPLAAVPVLDYDRRIAGLMGYIVARTHKVNAEHPDTPVTVTVVDEDTAAAGTLDLDRELVRVSIPGAEDVTGYVNEVEFPNMDRLVTEAEALAGELDAVTVAGDILRKIAKAADTSSGGPIRFRFAHKSRSAIRWEAVDAVYCTLGGLAMPLRDPDLDDADT